MSRLKQDCTLQRFDAYEIRKVGEFGLFAGGTEVIPLSECREIHSRI